MGGVMLDDLPPADMGAGALEAILARLDGAPPVKRTAPPPIPPALAAFPAPLRSYLGTGPDALAWQKLMPGIEQAVLVESGVARARLFRIAGGVSIPEHGHQGMELTVVLQGAFRDEAGHYRRGDVASADDGTVHRPVADKGETCLCLTVTDAPLRLTGLVGRLVNPFVSL
jgi:putative transcriptional regulator